MFLLKRRSPHQIWYAIQMKALLVTCWKSTNQIVLEKWTKKWRTSVVYADSALLSPFKFVYENLAKNIWSKSKTWKANCLVYKWRRCDFERVFCQTLGDSWCRAQPPVSRSDNRCYLRESAFLFHRREKCFWEIYKAKSCPEDQNQQERNNVS